MKHSRVRETAEAQFKRTQRHVHLPGADHPSEVELQRHADHAKTARLKELRLAKAAERDALMNFFGPPDGSLVSQLSSSSSLKKNRVR